MTILRIKRKCMIWWDLTKNQTIYFSSLSMALWIAKCRIDTTSRAFPPCFMPDLVPRAITWLNMTARDTTMMFWSGLITTLQGTISKNRRRRMTISSVQTRKLKEPRTTSHLPSMTPCQHQSRATSLPFKQQWDTLKRDSKNRKNNRRTKTTMMAFSSTKSAERSKLRLNLSNKRKLTDSQF